MLRVLRRWKSSWWAPLRADRGRDAELALACVDVVGRRCSASACVCVCVCVSFGCWLLVSVLCCRQVANQAAGGRMPPPSND